MQVRELTVGLKQGHWAMCTRSSASPPRISSALTSTVALWMVPVNLNGLALPPVTGELGLAPQVSAPGLSTNGVVTGASVFPARGAVLVELEPAGRAPFAVTLRGWPARTARPGSGQVRPGAQLDRPACTAPRAAGIYRTKR